MLHGTREANKGKSSLCLLGSFLMLISVWFSWSKYLQMFKIRTANNYD